MPLPGIYILETATSGKMPHPRNCHILITATSLKSPHPGNCQILQHARSRNMSHPGNTTFLETVESGIHFCWRATRRLRSIRSRKQPNPGRAPIQSPPTAWGMRHHGNTPSWGAPHPGKCHRLATARSWTRPDAGLASTQEAPASWSSVPSRRLKNGGKSQFQDP